jgi:hypothetical protein
MIPNVINNVIHLRKHRHMRNMANVTFKNGRKNVVFFFPRTYVNLANKYLNYRNPRNEYFSRLHPERKRIPKLSNFLINPNSVNWNALPERQRTHLKTLLNRNNYIIMRKDWVTWVNRNFHPTEGFWKNDYLREIGAFTKKHSNAQKYAVKRVDGKWVKGGPTLRNRAEYILKRIREQNARRAKLRLAVLHGYNYERARRRHNRKRFPELTFANLAV